MQPLGSTVDLANFVSKEIAQHIVELHNERVAEGSPLRFRTPVYNDENAYALVDPEPDAGYRVAVKRRRFFWLAIPLGTTKVDWVSPPVFVGISREGAVKRALHACERRFRFPRQRVLLFNSDGERVS